MESFMSWIGGKKLLRKKIMEQFPEKDTYKRYVEVFGGAGWVLFAEDRHASTEVYNDINGNLVNLFRCIKNHPDELQRQLEFTLISREVFLEAKEQIEMVGLTDIQRAARFYILIKESFGTNLRNFGSRNKDVDKAIRYLKEVSKRLNSVVIENLDFQTVIKNHDRVDTLFYLDPPYYETEKYYQDRFMPQDHERLRETLERVQGKFVLSYNDCEYIRELYKDYVIIESERTHNLVVQKKKPRYRELIIKNY